MLSALKNFGVTFLISALLFGIIAYFATGLVTNTVGQMLDDEDASLDNIIKNELVLRLVSIVTEWIFPILLKVQK